MADIERKILSDRFGDENVLLTLVEENHVRNYEWVGSWSVNVLGKWEAWCSHSFHPYLL